MSTFPISSKMRKIGNNIQIPLVDNINEKNSLKSETKEQPALNYIRKSNIINNPCKQDTNWLTNYLKSGGKASTPSIWRQKIPRLNASQKRHLEKDSQIPTANLSLKRKYTDFENNNINNEVNTAVTHTETKDNLKLEIECMAGKEDTKEIDKTKRSKLIVQKKTSELKKEKCLYHKSKCKPNNTQNNKTVSNSSNTRKCTINAPDANTDNKNKTWSHNIKVKNITSQTTMLKPKKMEDEIANKSVLNKKGGIRKPSLKNIPCIEKKINNKVKNTVNNEISVPSTTTSCDNVPRKCKNLTSLVIKPNKQVTSIKNLAELKKSDDVSNILNKKCPKKVTNKSIKNKQIKKATVNTSKNISDSKSYDKSVTPIKTDTRPDQERKTPEKTNYAEIKLTISIMCRNNEETIQHNENTTSSTVDVDFLDDFDVDEIVESLNTCESISNQEIEKTPRDDPVDFIKGIDEDNEKINSPQLAENISYPISNYGFSDVEIQENKINIHSKNKTNIPEEIMEYSDIIIEEPDQDTRINDVTVKNVSDFGKKNSFTGLFDFSLRTNDVYGNHPTVKENMSDIQSTHVYETNNNLLNFTENPYLEKYEQIFNETGHIDKNENDTFNLLSNQNNLPSTFTNKSPCNFEAEFKAFKSSEDDFYSKEKNDKLHMDKKIKDNSHQSKKVTNEKRTSNDKEQSSDIINIKMTEASATEELITHRSDNDTTEPDEINRKSGKLQRTKHIAPINSGSSIGHRIMEVDTFNNQKEMTIKCVYDKQKYNEHVIDFTKPEVFDINDGNKVYIDRASPFVESALSKEKNDNEGNITCSNENNQYTIKSMETHKQGDNEVNCFYIEDQVDYTRVIKGMTKLKDFNSEEGSKEIQKDRSNSQDKSYEDKIVMANEKVQTKAGEIDDGGQKELEKSINSKPYNNENPTNSSTTNQKLQTNEKSNNHENPVLENDNLVSQTTAVITNDCVSKGNGTEVSMDSKKNEHRQTLTEDLEERMFGYLHSKYSITSTIFRGKTSTIFKCEDLAGKPYAIKMKKYVKMSGIKKANMWYAAQAAISKKNLLIVELINDFCFLGNWCYLMEYYPKNLAQVLSERQKPFDIDHVQNLARQLVSAVMMLQHNNIVHADINPYNVLLSCCNKQLKLCNIDSACYVNDILVLPNTGWSSYRAPEVILGYPSGFGIDIWSTAVVLFEMATNTKLFPGKYNNSILFKQMCTLGGFPRDMIEKSQYKMNHFRGMWFTRIFGDNGQCSYRIDKLKQNGKLSMSIHEAYMKYWCHERNQAQRMADGRKIYAFITLLKNMLIHHPTYRISIEFVHADPFIDSQAYNFSM